MEGAVSALLCRTSDRIAQTAEGARELAVTVAERLVIALGGKIRVESEPDRGTWVTVTLPAQG